MPITYTILKDFVGERVTVHVVAVSGPRFTVPVSSPRLPVSSNELLPLFSASTVLVWISFEQLPGSEASYQNQWRC